jgi:hypothetical protein|tara:strand:- start:322 stop:468 length:147 start_codon:yes stop_codon:yes gene_type:complete
MLNKKTQTILQNNIILFALENLLIDFKVNRDSISQQQVEELITIYNNK